MLYEYFMNKSASMEKQALSPARVLSAAQKLSPFQRLFSSKYPQLRHVANRVSILDGLHTYPSTNNYFSRADMLNSLTRDLNSASAKNAIMEFDKARKPTLRELLYGTME